MADANLDFCASALLFGLAHFVDVSKRAAATGFVPLCESRLFPWPIATDKTPSFISMIIQRISHGDGRPPVTAIVRCVCPSRVYKRIMRIQIWIRNYVTVMKAGLADLGNVSYVRL